MTHADMLHELEECHAVTCFLNVAVTGIIEDREAHDQRVAVGAQSCFFYLEDKLAGVMTAMEERGSK